MKYLLDTDWLVDGVRQPVATQRRREQLLREGAAISVITAAEYFEGAFRAGGSDDEVSRSLALAREFLSSFPILPLSVAVAERFAMLRAQLRQQGNLISDMDLLIAATAIDAGLVLVTRNHRHFARVPGLVLLPTT